MADRLYSELLHGLIQPVVVGASVALAVTLADAKALLAEDPVDLLVAGVAVRDGDVLDVLPEWLGQRKVVRNAFVVTSRKEPHTLHVLSTLGLIGVFDQTSEGQAELSRALATIAVGVRYWSPTIIEAIATHCLPPNSICRRLTLTEKRVLAVIGDGSDDSVAADRLGMKESTVASIRRSLHRKLGIQHKGELLRMAIQLGFVRIALCDEGDSGPANPLYKALATAQLSGRKIT